MSALPECQSLFRDALQQGGVAETVFLAHVRGEPEAARRRLAAYRRSVMGNLSAALESTYPVVAQLVGGPFFRETARRYLLAHPSESGDLNELGAHFPAFLEGYGPAAELGYLPDVARLEWCVQRVYYAADGPSCELSALALAEPGDSLFFRPASAHARLDSAWPVAPIWTLHQSGAEEFDVDLSCSCHALVGRRAGRIFVQSLSSAQAALFDSLAAGHSLESATAAAFAMDEDFDLAATLAEFIGPSFFPLAWRETAVI